MQQAPYLRATLGLAVSAGDTTGQNR